MNSVKVKICGLTRASDVEAAVEAGADALGFVFADSPRRLEAHVASTLLRLVRPGVLRVGLFMRQRRADIEATLSVVTLDLLQFHGDEDNDFCRSFGLPFIKAVSVVSGHAEATVKRYPDASGILFDSHVAGGAGGTGRVFDWSLVAGIGGSLWLAGGLDEHNVARAIVAVRPDWVDVSSGVEDAPGIKNPARMRAFVAAARDAAANDH